MRSSLATGIAAVVLVTMLGGLAGWYAYLRTHTSAIKAADSARGFTSGANFLGIGGSTGGGLPSGDTGVTSADAAHMTPGATTSASTTSAALSSMTDTLTDRLSATGEAYFSTSTPPTTPRFWKAVKTPVAGLAFVTINGHPLVRYVERATGNIFSLDPWTGSVERLTNTLHPKTVEAYFAGESVIERSLAETGIETVVGTIGRTATTSSYVASAIDNNILSLSADPALKAMLYVRPSGAGSDIVLAPSDGSKPKTLWSSPLTNWEPQLVPGRSIVVQRASDGVPGFAFEIGKKGPAVIVGNVEGLQLVAHASSSAVLWSSSSAKGIELFARAAATATPVSFSLRTIAPKCAWASRATGSVRAYCAVPRSIPRGFLDLWHQGAFFTSDTFWEIDTSSGSSQALYATDDDVDVRYPQVDETGTFLAFINGRDDTLWILRIRK